MIAKDILEYYEWLGKVHVFVEDMIILASQNPNDPTYKRDTDDLFVNGFSLKGQNIEISRTTGNVFIHPDLLSCAKWLQQKEESNA